ncbi:hypothetical protein Nepgr_014205 [Nepenthes gracilis]|uniref:Uncharacterized protein n=1 Tax=Nepenthes gracilis TaxID=150966 RepID=A0AAD3SKG0_NEPGR|nr:hypothetical protein Nepgr_014205 [Nepenthes gracilis]
MKLIERLTHLLLEGAAATYFNSLQLLLPWEVAAPTAVKSCFRGSSSFLNYQQLYIATVSCGAKSVEPADEPQVEAPELVNEPQAEPADRLQVQPSESADQPTADLPPEPIIEPIIILSAIEPPIELFESIFEQHMVAKELASGEADESEDSMTEFLKECTVEAVVGPDQEATRFNPPSSKSKSRGRLEPERKI